MESLAFRFKSSLTIRNFQHLMNIWWGYIWHCCDILQPCVEEFYTLMTCACCYLHSVLVHLWDSVEFVCLSALQAENAISSSYFKVWYTMERNEIKSSCFNWHFTIHILYISLPCNSDNNNSNIFWITKTFLRQKWDVRIYFISMRWH